MTTFGRAIDQADSWVADMMAELGTQDRAAAFGALRAGLQALRDSLHADEAARLSARLPLLLRGLFFEGWSPAAHPPRPRSPDELRTLIARRHGGACDSHLIATALLRLLARRNAFGRLGDIATSLPTGMAA